MFKVIQEVDTFEIRRTLTHVLINVIISLGFIYYFGSQLWGNIEASDYFWAVLNSSLLFLILRGFPLQLKKLLKNTPILRIDTEGVYMQYDGYIFKSDIENLKLTDVENPKQRLLVFVKNPNDYLSRASGLNKILQEKLYKEAGTPFVMRLRGAFDRDKLSEFLAQY